MTAEDGPARGHLAALAGRFRMGRRPFATVVAAAALGLLARLVLLADRPMHYDEARVAYWGLRGAREGLWSYQPVVHGPLMQHLNRWLFPLLGSGDFAARLPVALVGGLLPLAALLFRDRLDDWEVAALAGLLAANPLLLYYSRFMRSDPLVAAFALVTLGALVRLYETRRPGYLYAAAGAFALAFASKENAVVYVLCWVGMLGLVAGLEVVDPRRFPSHGAMLDAVRGRLDAEAERLDGAAAAVGGLHAVGAALLFVALTVFLYAPRTPPGEGVGLWHSGLVPVAKHVVADVACGLEFWTPVRDIAVPEALVPADRADQRCVGFANGEEGPFANYARDLGRQVQILGKTAATVVVLSVVGMVAEFRRRRPRVLVPAAFYWGLASLVGYPVGADILFPAWVAIHTVVPLAVPAAAGAVALGRWTAETVPDGDGATAAALVLAAVLLVGSTAGAAVHHAYLEPTGERWSTGDGQMVQYAQPEHEMKRAVDVTRRASTATDGLDVLVYQRADGSGDIVDMGGANDHAVPCMKFLRSLPLSWYLYSFEAEVDCADDASRLEAGLGADPPIVVAPAGSASDVEGQVGDRYVAATYELRQGAREVTFFFDRTRVDPPPRAVREPSPRVGGPAVR